MKKGAKPAIFFVLFIMVAYAAVILGYVGVKLECDLLTKEKFESRKLLDAKRNRNLNLLAEVQFLSSEERIVKIAQEELKMIKRTEPKIVMHVNKDKIKKYRMHWRRFMNNSRAILVILGAIIFFLVLVFKLFDIQIVKSEELKYFAERQQMKIERIPPERGVIYDRNDVLLAYNRSDVSFFIDLRMAAKEDKRKVAEKFSSVFGKSVGHYLKLMEQSPKTICIERKVPAEKAILLKNFRAAGFFQKEDPTRIYHYKNLASHLLGYLNEDYSGVNGIEKEFNDLMKGEEGMRLVEKNAVGGVITVAEEQTRHSAPGYNIHLTIKRQFQSILEEELSKSVKEFDAASAIGIIMDPNTGEILAVANMNDYNPNRFWQYGDDARRNKIITDTYEPGSTFKAVTLASLIDQDICRESEIIDVENGRFKFRNANITDTYRHEKLTVKGVLEQSSNIGMAKLTQRMKDDTFYKYLRGFGFGNYTTLDLPGEVKGNLKKPNEWSALTKTFMSFGYEIAVTPVQLVAAYSAIINGGILYKPQIVKKITDNKGEIISFIDKKEIRRVISEETSQRMRSLLASVVEKGTGKNARLSYVSVGGKTGTSKKVVNGSYTSDYNSSFVGFFPAENPKVVCLILVNSPKIGKYGSAVAAPVFKRITEKLIGIEPGLIEAPGKDIKEREEREFLFALNSGDKKSSGSNIPVKNISASGSGSFEITDGIMPDLTNSSLREAITVLAKLGLKYKVNGSGRVVSQSIEPGNKVSEGTVCVIECKEVTVSGTYVY
jgi:cell division protein FtsI (penicillin-binding protein 3)